MNVEDFQKHKKDKFIETNKNLLFDILTMIRDQDSIPENESFSLNSLKGMQILKTYLGEITYSNYAVFKTYPTDEYSHLTFFVVENKDSFASCIAEFVNSFSENVKFRIAKTVFPKVIEFYEDKENGKRYILHEYKDGVIEC